MLRIGQLTGRGHLGIGKWDLPALLIAGRFLPHGLSNKDYRYAIVDSESQSPKAQQRGASVTWASHISEANFKISYFQDTVKGEKSLVQIKTTLPRLALTPPLRTYRAPHHFKPRGFSNPSALFPRSTLDPSDPFLAYSYCSRPQQGVNHACPSPTRNPLSPKGPTARWTGLSHSAAAICQPHHPASPSRRC
jgi:hypothetical protein